MRDAVTNASVQAERWDSKEKRYKNHIANLEEELAKLKLQNANARRENTESVSSLQSKLKEAKDHAHQIVRKYNDALNQSGHIVYNLPEGCGRLVRKDVYDAELVAREELLLKMKAILEERFIQLEIMGSRLQVEISQSELVRNEQMRTSMCLHTSQQELRVRDIRVKNLERARKNLYQQKRRQHSNHQVPAINLRDI